MIRVKTFSHDSGSVEYSAQKCADALNEYLDQNPGAHLCNYMVHPTATGIGSEMDGYYYTFTITAVLSMPDPSPFMEGSNGN
jgi:hypothetical protein